MPPEIYEEDPRAHDAANHSAEESRDAHAELVERLWGGRGLLVRKQRDPGKAFEGERGVETGAAHLVDLVLNHGHNHPFHLGNALLPSGFTRAQRVAAAAVQGGEAPLHSRLAS